MIFVDTNVIIDLLEPDPVWAVWSANRLADAAVGDVVTASAIVAAECAGRFASLGELRFAFRSLAIEIEEVPLEAMFAAGQAFRDYRRTGTKREKILSDFLIGAHAAHAGSRLITRDVAIYRRYFPDLILVTPETNP